MRPRISLALIFESLVLGALLTVSADLYAHKRVDRRDGVNVWGSRGPVMTQKSGREIRVAVCIGDLRSAGASRTARRWRTRASTGRDRNRKPDSWVRTSG